MVGKKSFFYKIRITYNAPVTLTFSILAALILLADNFLYKGLIFSFFTAPAGKSSTMPFHINLPLDYFRLVFHVFGHSDWNHLTSNLAFILLPGPLIEEKYGSPVLILMMVVTALVTGVLNACFGLSPLIGASGLAFMMILLASFTSIIKSQIPLSFIFVLILYIGREIAAPQSGGNISTLTHIAGGLCGSLFAFLATPKQRAGNQLSAKEKKRLQELDSQSPRFSGKNQLSDKDSTLVGSIEF